MKRTHRSAHRLIWLLLAPLLLAILALALWTRPGEALNETLPPDLIEEAS